MAFSRGRSLYRRLVWTSLASIVAIWSLLLIWFYWEVTRVGTGFFDRDLSNLAGTVAAVYSTDVGEPGRSHVIERQIFQFSRSYSNSPLLEHEFAYRIVAPTGPALAQSGVWPVPGNPEPGAPPVNRGRWRVVSAQSENRAITVQIAIERGFVQRAQAEILVFFLLPLLVTLPVMIVLLQLGFGRALLPLNNLARAISERNPSSTQPLASPDSAYRELAPVFTSVNVLLSRLASYREGEQRFFADAAHEMRTPLAALGAQIHLLEQAASEQERSDIAARLQESLSRCAELVGKLLALSRLESESTRSHVQIFDLAVLAREALARHAPHAIACGMDIAYEGADTVPYAGDAIALDSLLDNLLDNAIRYCPQGSAIRLEAEEGFHCVRLAVYDDGPGIPPEWREEALKRFVRLPDTSATGSGLGLAIVKRVVELHGGSLLLGDGLHGRGLGVEIRLPAAGVNAPPVLPGPGSG
ncbi:ATP-binding protein [Paludibacterium paludis]|uniref:histidine kinase n=1 Tax=Paludibacterium paludis TaxID=1225769 RepID=A0A918P2V5_9NEIS|nr:ATP-binding protein [Paludibacterium paludis]GGY14741.1 two-component sensor histidine kinase [Paludibacterium paludis]